MAITALALYILWAILAFGWKTIHQYRRTGDNGLRLHAQPNTPQWWAKIGFSIAILVGLAAPIAAVAGLDNIGALDAKWLQVAGIAVTVIGILLTVAALETQVRLVEEPYLLTLHGDTYRVYAQTAGRFAPGIGRVR